MPRILIFDVLFPVLYGKWRTIEINHFLSHPLFETDILVSPYQRYIDSVVKENLDVHFQRYYQTYPYLNDYNILIFNPIYNFLNKFNKRLNGTLFNGKAVGDFLLTKKLDFDWTSYDVGYSIFLMARDHNYKLINSRLWPSVCKIYPGGGYTFNNPQIKANMALMKHEYIISTQAFITIDIQHFFPPHHFKTIYGCPTLDPKEDLPDKILSPENRLNICFTSLGPEHQRKGYNNYSNLVLLFSTKYPTLDITFHVVGGCTSYPIGTSNVKYHRHYVPKDLSKFYIDTIDIIISCNNKHTYPDGFPLGSEAMICGCIPILCDPWGSNAHFKFGDDCSLVMPYFDISQVEQFILSLYHDPLKRNTMSTTIKEKCLSIFGPENQLVPVSDFILDIVEKNPKQSL